MSKIINLNITTMNPYYVVGWVGRQEYKLDLPKDNINRMRMIIALNRAIAEDHPESIKLKDEEVSVLVNSAALKIKAKFAAQEQYGRITALLDLIDLKYEVVEPEGQKTMEVGEYEDGTIEYNKYIFNGYEFYVQSDGYCLLTAPTGNGKTFNATRNMLTVGEKYKTIVYVNFELTKDDILIKLLEHTSSNFKKVLELEKKLVVIKDDYKNYFMDASKFINLLSLYPESFIIIDNIDNLKDGSENEYLKQSAFIQKLDSYLKSTRGRKSTALVLTQLTKDKESLYKEIKDGKEKRMILNPE